MKFDATHQVKWNKSTHARRHFTRRRRISRRSCISQIPQGIYFVEKDLCFVSKHRSFSGGGCEIRTHGGFDPITGFQDQLHKPLGQPSVFGAMFNSLRKPIEFPYRRKYYNSQKPTATTTFRLGVSETQSGFQDWLPNRPDTAPCGVNYTICLRKSQALCTSHPSRKRCAPLSSRENSRFGTWQSFLPMLEYFGNQLNTPFIRSDTQEAEGAPLLRE